MSFQRAYMNCMRCYKLADQYYQGHKSDALKNDQLYSARNEAMKALENHEGPMDIAGGSEVTESVIMREALNACAVCNLNQPSIANIVNKELKLKEDKESE